MAVTIRDIAREAGVTHATVSYVLNNKAGEKGISEETRERVRAIAGQLNYRTNIIARSLVKRETMVIGLLLPCVTHSFWPRFARSVEDAARENGYSVLLCHMNDDWLREAEEIGLLLEHRVAGLIISPAYSRQDVKVYEQLRRDRLNVVLVDQCLDGVECSFVGTDDRGSAYEAVTHLIGLGHRRVGHLAGPEAAPTAQGRLRGYREALADSDIALDPELVKGNGFMREDGYEAAQELLALERRPTAVFTVTDMAAVGAMQAFRERGVRVPEDMAVVGYADTEEASIVHPALTTVREPVEEMGRTAMDIILRGIEEDSKKGDRSEGVPRRTEKVVLKCSLIVRQSCGAEPVRLDLCGKKAVENGNGGSGPAA